VVPFAPARKLRILIVNYEFPPMGGGASFASYGLARTLAARGHRVDVLTSRLKGQANVEELEGVRVYRVASWRKGMHDCGLRGAFSFLLFGFLRLRTLLKQERYDLIHYFFGMPCGLLSLYSSRKSSAPYLVSLRGSDVPGYDSADRTLGLLHRLLEPLNRRIWRNAAVVVPNSIGLGELAVDFDPGIPYEVVPNAVTDTAALDVRLLRERLSGQSTTRLLCVARLIARKGIDTLLQAASTLRDENFVLEIAGSGNDEQQLRRRAEQLGLGDKVQFLGGLDRNVVLERYRSADVFVLPTNSESCSMALLEAMSSGLPIISTRVGGNPYLVKDGENGLLVEPGDAVALADAIRQLIRHPAQRVMMGQANLEGVAREFTWSTNARRYEQLYLRALTPNG
jgi:glycosyltransferase involved in cell wall biosynthesis